MLEPAFTINDSVFSFSFYVRLCSINDIEDASNIDLSGYVEQEEYNGKIAELEGKVNEAFTNANNGKQLIANAIGEPVSADDTFSAMSNDINGLLSSFKTNMMNNGVTVESGDKFKSLIDKIATMVEEGSGKGIQFASGSLDGFSLGDHNDYVDTHININFGFIPNFVFILKDLTTTRWVSTTKLIISNIREENMSIGNGTYWAQLVNVTENGVDIRSKTKHSTQSYGLASNCTNVQYYAIGVGEEDTTGGLDISIVESLPDTVTENKLCVIAPVTDGMIYVDRLDNDEAVSTY
jgi:hypothetical protein